MTDEEVTYTTVRFHKSSGLQNPVRPEETQRPRKTGHREYSVPWKLIVIILGILCSLLLVTVAVLVTHIFQYRQEKHKQEKITNNISEENQAMEKDISLKEEMLRNKSSECDALKDRLPSLRTQQNRCYRETKIVLDCLQHTGKRMEGYWFCCGIKCYYFITDKKKWNGCKQACQTCSFSLLQIDDEDELKFLKSQLYPNSYWIGLKHNKSKGEWQWIGNGSSKLDLAGLNSVHQKGSCAYLSFIHIEGEDCGRTHGCICEKRLNKFPVALSCVKERTQSAVQSDEVET